MKRLARQDRNGTRTSEDLRRRYKLNEIELTAEEVEYLKQFIEVDSFLSTTSIHPVQNKVVTEALNSKVAKETGKGLSTNDFSNEYKEKLDDLKNLTKVSELQNDANYITQQAADTKYFTNTSAETYATLMNKKVPTGGTKGQILAKKSNADNDTEWINQEEATGVVDITGSDLNEKYGELIIAYGNSCINKPEGSQNGFFLNLPHTGSPLTYNKQFWFNRMNTRSWTRSMENGVWTEWYSCEIISSSINDNEGYVWYANGTLEQWGRVSITPTAANTVTSLTIKFPRAYDKVPDIDAIPQANTPNAITWSVGGGSTTDEAKQGMIIYATRTNTSATLFKWRAKGFKNP